MQPVTLLALEMTAVHAVVLFEVPDDGLNLRCCSKCTIAVMVKLALRRYMLHTP